MSQRFLLMDKITKAISNNCQKMICKNNVSICYVFALICKPIIPLRSHVILAIFVVRHFHVRINWSFPGSCSNNLLHDMVVLASGGRNIPPPYHVSWIWYYHGFISPLIWYLLHIDPMFEYRWGTIVSAISAFSLAVSQSLFERKMAILLLCTIR